MKKNKKRNKLIKTNEFNLFGSRKEVDGHTANLLRYNQFFQADLQRVRDLFWLPKIKISSDLKCGYFSDYKYDDPFHSVFIDALSAENLLSFKKEIVRIIEKYRLGMNFFTWVQWYILYREPMSDSIALNYNFFIKLKDDIGELFRLPFNTQEKKRILAWYRESKKIPATGRIPKEKAKLYNYFKSVLNRKKLNIRKPKTDYSVDFQVIERHGKIEMLDNKPIMDTYLTLVADLLPLASEKEDLKSIQTMRKRKERLLKQINKLKN